MYLLKKANINTVVGELGEEAQQLNEAYAKLITTGAPFVTAKFAVSLDGKIATRSGDSGLIKHIFTKLQYSQMLMVINDPHHVSD